jgi:predicted DNA-binding protein YlxM (UPF0122 family)
MLQGVQGMAKDLQLSYLLDFYGDVLTEKQHDVMEQYYNDDLSLSEIAENFGISRQGVRDAIKHGESTLLDLEQKVGFAARYHQVQDKLAELEDIVKKARFENSGVYGRYTAEDFDRTLDKMLAVLNSMKDEG